MPNITGSHRLGFWFQTQLSVEWSLTQSGLIGSGGWALSNQGRRIRFNIEDDSLCNGYNSNVQSGMATATISTGNKRYLFTPSLTGVGELQDANFELMSLYLNGVEIVRASASGGQLGCGAYGAVTINTLVAGPHLLDFNTVNSFLLSFTTNDEYYHDTTCFYQCDLTFTQI